MNMNNPKVDVEMSYLFNLSHLTSGKVDEMHFRLLIEVTSINSEKVIHALRAFLVNGESRKSACEEFGVNPGYFSLKLRQLQQTSQSVVALIPYYSSQIFQK